MKHLILCLLLSVAVRAQISPVLGTDTFPQARVKINANDSYLNTQVGLKASLSHVHLIADVTGLQTALDGKSATTHNHDSVYQAVSAILTQFSTLACAEGQIPKKGASAWECAADTVGAGTPSWGAITGTLSAQTDLQSTLDAKAASDHNHAATYAPIAKGVTNGDTHDHSGGDGAQIDYATLSGLPALGTAAAQNTSAFEAANANIQTHIGRTDNPHSVTAAQVGAAVTVYAGTKALGTAAIASTACTTLTQAATGVLTTDIVSWSFASDVTAVTGYAPVTTGGLAIYIWPTADTINLKVCNPTGNSITPGADISLNLRVTR
jgi:hypothetical protein